MIPVCLERMHLPANVRTYISSLYGNLSGKVQTSDWVSEEFKFRKGVFQGDPLSPIIFLICFNPILEDLKTFEGSDGYCLGDISYITLPFADDFNLITRDIRKHRKLMARLQDLTSSMGLRLKPRKCRSLSIKSGKSVDLPFSLGDAQISSILHDKCHKFLGGFYTFNFSVPSVANIIKERIGDQLKNVDALLIRNEYKVRIYSEYFLGANRFVFSVHDLCLSQLNDLNALTHRYLKKWLGLPNGASWALVHDAHGLNIKSISHLYMESRALSLSKIRLFGDDRVRHALDSKEDREEKWCRKFSSATYVRDVLAEVVPQVAPNNQEVVGNNLDLSLGSSEQFSPLPEGLVEEVAAVEAAVHASAPTSRALTRNQLKSKIQGGVQSHVDDFWKEKVGHYIMQGDYLALLMEEDSCITWKSYLWDIPQGVLNLP